MIPYTTIHLDKPYKLRLGMAAMYEYEKITGQKIMELSDDVGIKTYANLIWVMLKQDDSKITLEKTLDLIDNHCNNITEVIDILTEALNASFGEGDKENPKKPTKKFLDFTDEFKLGVGELGLKPKEFWELTYAEFRELTNGKVRRQRQRRNEMMSAAWHIAALQRTKRLPSHESMIEKEPKKPQSVDEMINVCRAIAFMHGGKEQIVDAQK